MPSCRYYYLKFNKRMKENMKISHAFSIKIEWSHSTKSLERIVGIHTIFKMKKQLIKFMDKFFYIEFYVYHNQQIWAKLVGLRARHPLRFTRLCSCVTAATLLLNNYWADGQHKVPGIKCSHTCNLQKEERINQIRQEVFVI